MSVAWAWLRRNALLIYAGIAVLYMLLPIFVIALFSFDQTTFGRLDYTWSGFTLEYWQDAFSVTAVNDAMITSIQLAALATIVSTAIGTLMALALVRHRFRGRGASNLLIVLPMATPEIVIGASLLSMFLIYGLELGFTTLFIAHVMFSISFVVVVVRSRLIGFDRSLEEAAADLGAPPWKSFWLVTFPLALPGLVAGSLLCFIPAVGEFVIPDLLGGSDTLMIGRTLWTEFFTNRSWSIASTIAVLLLLVLVVPIALYQNIQSRSLERS